MKIEDKKIRGAFERAVEARVFVYIQNNFGQDALADFLNVLENKFDSESLIDFENKWEIDIIAVYKDVELEVLREAQEKLNKAIA